MDARRYQSTGKQRVWFSPVLLAVVLMPAFMQIQYTCNRSGDTRLASLELEVSGVDQLAFDPAVRVYDVTLQEETQATLRAVPMDSDARVTWYVPDGQGMLASGVLGVGGGEVTIDLPPDGYALYIGVFPPGGAINTYIVNMNYLCPREVCDFIDNDCDGEIDEGMVCECLSNADCYDGTVCTEEYCDYSPDSAICVSSPVPTGTDCSAEHPPLAVCEAGVCMCNACIEDFVCDSDGNDCTSAYCDMATGCCEVGPDAPDGTACDFGGLPGVCFAGVCEEDDSCPVLTRVTVVPLQADVGDDINVSADASGTGPIDYLWTATAGSFVDPSLPITAYRCEQAGVQDLTITISDGTGSCMDEITVTVTCLADLCANVDCDDGDPCTADSCDPLDGTCSSIIICEDTAAPVLTGFVINPATFDVTDGPVQGAAILTVTDDLVGVSSLSMNYHSPSGLNKGVGCGSPISGDINNGQWSCFIYRQPGDEAGSWPIIGVTLNDRVGNAVTYNTQDLQSLGFPTQFEVIYVQSPPP